MTVHAKHAHGDLAIAAPAEDLCLAFANTRYWRGRETSTETLTGYDDVLSWLGANAGLPASILAAATDWAADHAESMPRRLAEAIEIREAIYRLFTRVAAGEPIPDAEIAPLNAALAAAPSRVRLIRREKKLGWAAKSDVSTVPALLAPILWSAADLLTHAGDRRVRRCANDACLWLFMDHSKGGTRRWCDMNSCGNRAKSKRHYLRAKQDKGSVSR